MKDSSTIIQNHRWIGLVVVIILLLLMTLTTRPVLAQSGVEPVVNCITNNGDGTYTANFGYTHSQGSTTIPVGVPDNYFDPPPEDRGQPVNFTPGNHDFVVAVVFNSGTSISWHLNGTTATANNLSEPCPPIAMNDSYDVTPNTQKIVPAPGVLGNDHNNSTNQLTASVVTTTTNGTLLLSANGSFDYTPNNGFVGIDTFTYVANDGFNNSNTATVTLTVQNVAPVAAADAYNTPFNTPLNIGAPGVLTNDTDADGNPLTAVQVTAPTNASSFTLNADGSFSYTPNPTYSGTDSFSYQASDGLLLSNVVSVSITVANGVPVANNDSYNTPFNTPLNVSAPGVLGNDTDGNGQALSASLVTGPANAASFNLNADGSFSYTPNATFSGTDSFTYTASDGIDSSTAATVTITVANSAPVATADSYNTDLNTQLIVSAPGVLGNDADANSDPLTAILVSGPSSAANFFLSSDGSFTYTPNPAFSGDDTFTYKANDGTDDSNTVTVTITVANSAPVATADSYNAAFNTQLVVNAPGVLGNDTDGNNHPLTAILVSGPSNAANFLLSSDGSFSYTPNSTFSGDDTFTYKANDGIDDSNTVTVTITVANGVPVAADDAYNTAANTPLNIAAPGVLDNDVDGNGQTLTASLVAGPTHAASFSLNPDGSFSYTPAADFSGPDTFTYTASDGIDTSNTATVTISVANTAPVATDDDYSAAFNTPIVVSAPGVLGNDTDAEGQSMTASLVTGPANAASFNLNADGSFSYTPNATFSGTDSFTYVANDGIGDSNTATVTLNIANAVPAATGDSYNVVFGFTFTQPAPGVLANDTDANGTALTAVLVSGPSHAADFTLNSNGSFEYTGSALYVGPDSFTYYASDGTDISNTVTVNLTIGKPTPRQRISPAPGRTMDTGYFPLIWGHDPATKWYHNVLVDDAGSTIYNQWVEAAQVCDASTLICRVDYQWVRDSVYTWWMRTWNPTDGMSAYDNSTFIVDGSIPSAIPRISPTDGQTFTTAPDGVDLVWQEGHQDAWYRVQIKNSAGTLIYNQWHERETVCASGTCSLQDRWLSNGTYTWSLLAWSPSGMGPETLTSFTLNVAAISGLTRDAPADAGTLAAGTVTLSWQHDPRASWYRIVLVGPTPHDQWYRGSEIGCGSGMCSVNINLAAGIYSWWMAPWGPGGTGTWEKSTFNAQ